MIEATAKSPDDEATSPPRKGTLPKPIDVLGMTVDLLRLGLMYARGDARVLDSRTASFFNTMRRELDQYKRSRDFPGRKIQNDALSLLHAPLCEAVHTALKNDEHRESSLAAAVRMKPAWLTLNQETKKLVCVRFKAARWSFAPAPRQSEISDWVWFFLGKLMNMEPETVRKRADEVSRSFDRLPDYRGEPIQLQFAQATHGSVRALIKQLLGNKVDVSESQLFERVSEIVSVGEAVHENDWNDKAKRAEPAIHAADVRKASYSAGVKHRKLKAARKRRRKKASR